MAEEITASDVDSMSAEEVHDLAGKMSAGEVVSKPQRAEAPGKVIEVDDEGIPSDDAGDNGDPEGSEPTGDKPEGERTKSEFVRFGKFEQERQRRIASDRKAEEATNAAAERVRLAEERMAQLIETFVPKQEAAAAPERPSLDVNPIGFMGEFAGSVEQQLKQLKEYNEQREQSEQQQRMLSASQGEFQRAKASDPDMDPAYGHVFNSFANELRLYGYKTPDQAGYSPDVDLQRELNRLETQNVYYALQNGIPLNEHIKQIAASRGWQPAPKQEEAQGEDFAAQAADKQQIKRQAASLTNGGGSPARTGAPTPQELLDMSPEQFKKFRESHDVRRAFNR